MKNKTLTGIELPESIKDDVAKIFADELDQAVKLSKMKGKKFKLYNKKDWKLGDELVGGD